MHVHVHVCWSGKLISIKQVWKTSKTEVKVENPQPKTTLHTHVLWVYPQ